MKSRNYYFILLLIIVIPLLTIIYHHQNKYIDLIKDQHRIRLEIARTAEQRERGLMYRKYLAENQGMIFLFQQPQRLGFWMKNTLIPLDMIFLNKNNIVAIIENIPPCPEMSPACPTYSPYEQADTVIELNAGMVKKMNIKTGEAVEFS